MRPLLALAAVTLSAGAALAANDSTFTDLDIKKCIVTERAPPDNDENGKPEAYAWRCKGYADWNVFVAEGDLRAGVAFGHGRRFEGEYQFFPKFSTTGPKVEWRGPRKGDRVVPVAAILRFVWGADGRKGSVLAVARLGSEESDTCVFAWIDAVANPDANAMAQAVADERAVSAACGAGDPQWIGKVSQDLR